MCSILSSGVAGLSSIDCLSIKGYVAYWSIQSVFTGIALYKRKLNVSKSEKEKSRKEITETGNIEKEKSEREIGPSTWKIWFCRGRIFSNFCF